MNPTDPTFPYKANEAALARAASGLGSPPHPGIPIRLWLAAEAMKGLLSTMTAGDFQVASEANLMKATASLSLHAADALLQAHNETT